jgi:hypothetical protein
LTVTVKEAGLVPGLKVRLCVDRLAFIKLCSILFNPRCAYFLLVQKTGIAKYSQGDIPQGAKYIYVLDLHHGAIASTEQRLIIILKL